MNRQTCRANGLKAELHHAIDFVGVRPDDDGVVHVDGVAPRGEATSGTGPRSMIKRSSVNLAWLSKIRRCKI